jgi:hypothetical protein
MDQDQPDFRATVRRDGTLRLVHCTSWLVTSGPLNTLLDARGRAGVGIADLTVLRDEDHVAIEVIVDFRCGGEPKHREALCDWAGRVGYRRVWFDGQVVELDPLPGGAAQTRCTGCRARLVDAGPSFWQYVRHHGAFPTACVLCGSDVPQWTPVGQMPADPPEPQPTQPVGRPAWK